MACRTPGDPQLIYGEIDVSLSSVGIDRLNNSKSSAEEHETSLSSEESHVGSEGEETTGSEQRTFLVIVNDDGSFSLGNRDVSIEGPESDTVIPVTLPLNKMKSIEQPLPGARNLPTTGRTRKAKLQTRTCFGSESDTGYEFVPPSSSTGISNSIALVDLESTVSPLDIHLPSARGVLVSGTVPLEAVATSPAQSPIPASVIVSSPTENTPPSIDVVDWKQLDPQSLANLENVLQSVQAREILETLALDDEEESDQSSVKGGSTQPLWDHSYSQSVPSTSTTSSSRTVITGPSVVVSSTSVIVPVQSVIQTTISNSSPSVSIVRRNSDSNSLNATPIMSPVVNNNSTPKARQNSSTPGNGRRISEVDDFLSSAESSASIRRSQRQQDRIERQEAERIMAENQQMLQREKEIMKEAKSSSAVSSPINSPVPSVPPTTTPISLPESPVTVVTPVQIVASPAISVAHLDDSNTTPISESGRPKRQNRKLPAHLADPNYVHFDEELKVVQNVSKSEESEPEEDEVQEVDVDPSTAEGDDEEITEDDPNRLWCICRQPHNNRFMICCDRCEEWFHGKCVGVTKAQGKAMELKKVLWHCPNCKKELKPTKTNPKAVTTPRRNSDVPPAPQPQSLEQTPAVVVKKPGRGRPPKNKNISTTPVTSNSSENITESPSNNKQIRRKGETSLTRTESSSEKSNKCMVCGGRARKDSAYCSDKCVQKWADTVGSKAVAAIATKPTAPAPNTPQQNNSSNNTTAVPSSSPIQKLKRTNSLKLEPEKSQPFLTFHVISSGSAKSTETVPPRPKELTASAIVKQNQLLQQAGANPQVKSPTTPTSQTIPTALPTVSGSSLKIDTGLAQNLPQAKKGGQTPPTPVNPGGNKRPRTTSETSVTKTQNLAPPVKKNHKDVVKIKEKEKEPERDGPISEKLLRENMRKTLRETLKERLKETTEIEKRFLESSGSTPEIVAEKIEEELFRCYGGLSNPKCKTKYRSIVFNFKDLKNSLFREILSGNIKPKALVRMEPQQMASAELAEWRLKENQKELEAIKRAELDKLAEAKKQQLLDSGVDDAVVVAEETRPKDITDVIDSERGVGERDKKEKKSGSHSHSSHRREKEKRSKDKDDKRRESKDHSSNSKDKDRRDRDKEKDSHRRSSRHRHRSSEKSKEKDKRSKEKGDVKESSRSIKSETIVEPALVNSKDVETDSKTVDKKDEIIKKEIEGKVEDTSTSLSENSTPQQTTPTENLKSDPRHSTDSEQEQPSSTIKTPDFVEDGSHSAQFALLNGSGFKPIFKSQLTMQELGNLAVSVYNVSHVGLQGTLFPEAPVPFVGRISPETVWDYINKMKKTKEVVVFRLAPASPSDTAVYNSFYDYLSARSRLGVLGSINHPLKDVYLCPLDKHASLNMSLLPFRGGPGIPKERTNCLLAIVTRHIVDVHHQSATTKRKASLSSEVGKKKLKVDTSKIQKPTSNQANVGRKLSNDVKGEDPLISMDVLTPSLVKAGDKTKVKDDDDEPYTPWEEDENEVEVKTVVPVTAAANKPNTQELIEELNAKIERERQEIESIAGAISNRKNMTGIPGLDGDFPESPLPTTVAKIEPAEQVPFFLRSNKDVSGTTVPSPLSQSVTIPGFDMATETFSSQSAKEVIEICEDEYDDEPVEIKVQNPTYAEDPRRASLKSKISHVEQIVSQSTETIPGLTGNSMDNEDLEAYSPSAIEFSDEEDKKVYRHRIKCKFLCTNSFKTEDSISQDTTVEDDEPLPPGVEEESNDVLPTSMTKSIKIEDPRLALPLPVDVSPLKPHSSIIVDLVDDSEPPPPGEMPTLTSTPIKIIMPKVFETSSNDFPFPSMVTLQKTPQKVKININLSTKSLPPATEKQDSVATNKESSSPKNFHRPPPMLEPINQAHNKTIPPLQMCTPPPTMTKLNQPPPSMPGLQNAPITPTMSIPIQLPPPSMQNISAIPVPVQIPPPNLQTGPPPPRISLGINVNVPPPPLSGIGIIPQIPGMMARGLPPLTPGGIRFPPPTSIPPPPTVLPPPLPSTIPLPPTAPADANRNVSPAVIGGVRRPFIPPVPNPLAKAGPRPNTPRSAGPSDLVTETAATGQRILPENHNEHNVRVRDRESRFDRNSRDRDLDIERRRGYQPSDRGRNFRRKPFDNRVRRRSRSDDRSTRSRSRERRRRRGGRSRSRSPPVWRRRGVKRSRSRSPRSNRRSIRTRSRSRSNSPYDLKSPGGSRQSNYHRSSKSKDKSRSRSRSPKRSYSRRSRSRSRSKSKSHSPSNSSRSIQRFSSEMDRSPNHDSKSPIVGSREEDWEDDPTDDDKHAIVESKLDADFEKEATLEFPNEKVGSVSSLHLSPEVTKTP